MTMLDKLAMCEGKWRGTSSLQLDPDSGNLIDSHSTAVITRIAGDRFVRIDYTWSNDDKPQDGSYLIGYIRKTGEVTAHWIDSFHMGSKVMACIGTADDAGVISLLGSYEAPPGPDWGWRTIITPEADSLRILMNNIWPEGREDLAVDARYVRE